MAEARAAIEAGTYAAYASDKLEAIDRHEHADRRLGARDDQDAHESAPTTDRWHEFSGTLECEVVRTRSGALAMRIARPAR